MDQPRATLSGSRSVDGYVERLTAGMTQARASRLGALTLGPIMARWVDVAGNPESDAMTQGDYLIRIFTPGWQISYEGVLGVEYGVVKGFPTCRL